ncbi:MAG: HipA family kinase [Candidatus Acidiferrales bacterium]
MFAKSEAVARVCALEYICRMHGGSQPKLMRCSDGKYYVVKFQNNPEGVKTLANELLATLMAERLDLPVPEPAIVEVHPDLVRYTGELVIEQRHGSVRCRPGLCFGSLYGNGESSPANPSDACNALPESQLAKVHNLSDFLGMLVFDEWIGNTDTRQTIFIRNHSLRHPYRVLMIDEGLCFNGTEWNFPDAPRRGLYPHRAVYANVWGMEAFGLWLMRLDRYMNRDVLDRAAEEIPPEWYPGDADSLARLLARLDERRKKIRDLLLSTRKAAPEFFPSWYCPDRKLLHFSRYRQDGRAIG